MISIYGDVTIVLNKIITWNMFYLCLQEMIERLVFFMCNAERQWCTVHKKVTYEELLKQKLENVRK